MLAKNLFIGRIVVATEHPVLLPASLIEKREDAS